MSTQRTREVAYRLFASEYDDADLEYTESDEDRAPNFVVTPAGARANRAFVVGVLTEITPVGDEEVLRARVADPTGAFVLYAGQYQPEALAVIEEAEPPAFLAVTGKARTFQPEDGERTFTSLRPETITHVDGDVRDHHVVTTAERTIERVDTMGLALQSDLTGDTLRGALETAGLDTARADGIALAIDHYSPTPAYLGALRERAIQALRVVAGEREEVEALEVGPDDGQGMTAAEFPTAFAAIEGPLEAPSGTEESTARPATASMASADTDSSTDQSQSESLTGADVPDAATEQPSAETESAGEPGEESVASTAGDADAESVADGSSGVAPAGSATEPTVDAASEQPAQESAGESVPDAPAENDPEDSATETPPVESATTDGSADATEAGGSFELDDDQREELESEFPTDFETGNDVEEAGEADIDVPDVEDLAETEPESGADSDQATDGPSGPPDGEDSSTLDSEDGVPAQGAVDLEDAVVERMATLDDGDGVEREALIAAVVENTGSDPDAVDAAIDDALMDGRCYAPGDERLKPI